MLILNNGETCSILAADKVVMTPAVRNLCSKRFSSVFTYNILHIKDSAACVSFVLKGSVQFPLISYKLKR